VVQTIPLGEDIDNIGPEYHISVLENQHMPSVQAISTATA
jgi:hypothetical protein